MNKGNRSFNGAILFLAIVLLIVVSVMAGNVIQVPYTGLVAYTDKEPYTAYETYSEDQVRVVQEPIKYEVLKRWSSSKQNCVLLILGCQSWGYLNLDIRNTDNAGGSFKIDFTIVKSDGGTLSDSKTVYVPPFKDETVTMGGYKFDIKSWTYKVIPSRKDVTRTEQIQKTREVLKYRDVRRTKEVIKYHSLFDHLGF